jgi:RimJ/RimL family protein N-acetyltransferase
MKLETQRLFLEPFALPHLDALHAMDADPKVMRFLGPLRSKDETRTAILRIAERWLSLGYGWWALRHKDSGAILGAACVQNLAQIPDAPLEIGWRLTPSAQGQGYATEAGHAALRFAFENLAADCVLAVADPENIASHRVMQRLGMTYRGLEDHYAAQLTTYVRYRDPALQPKLGQS